MILTQVKPKKYQASTECKSGPRASKQNKRQKISKLAAQLMMMMM
jgi:hypothetical protein